MKSHNTPAASCLNKVVVEWLKLNSSLSSLPTWSHLIKAIAQINMEGVAKALQQSHPVPRHNTSGREHPSVVYDESICVRQYCSNIRVGPVVTYYMSCYITLFESAFKIAFFTIKGHHLNKAHFSYFKSSLINKIKG